MKLEISTRQFEFAHGKKPRGFGHWAFFFNGVTAIDLAFWAQGTYAEAAKQARAHAKANGFTRIEVGS